MGYSEALEAAGANVIDYKEVGSYQGDWGAIVNFSGQKGLVVGSYGSCSGCDSFQAEFDDYSELSYRTPEELVKYGEYETIDDAKKAKEEYQNDYNKRLASFGASYLTVIQNGSDVKNQLSNLSDGYFDEERKELLNWAYEKLTQ